MVLVFYTDYVFKHSLDNSFADNTIAFGVDSQEDDGMLAIGQGNITFNNKTVNVKASYRRNISATEVKNVLSIHYNKKNSYVFTNGDKIIEFTVKDSDIKDDPICLGNISEHFSEDDTRKTRLYGSVYFFSVD